MSGRPESYELDSFFRAARSHLHAEFGGQKASSSDASEKTIEIPSFGNAYEIMRRLLGLPDITLDLQYVHLDEWSWTDRYLLSHETLWRGYLTGALSELEGHPGWMPNLSEQYIVHSGPLIAHYLMLVAPHVQSIGRLKAPSTIPTGIGHVQANLRAYSAVHDIDLGSTIVWRIVVDLLYQAYWQSSSGRQVGASIADVVSSASRRFTRSWMRTIPPQLSADIETTVNFDRGRIEGPGAALNSIHTAFDAFLEDYSKRQQVESLEVIERDYLAAITIFDSAIDYVASRALKAEIPEIDRLIAADREDARGRTWSESLLFKILGLYVYPEMAERGDAFLNKLIDEGGRRVVARIFDDARPIPRWSDVREARTSAWEK